MKILYLYERWKSESAAAQFHRSRRLSTELDLWHRVCYAYAVLTQEAYDKFNSDDPGKPELIGAEDFLRFNFDCVVLDGRIFENRIATSDISGRSSRASLRGGMTVFLADFCHEVVSVMNSKLSENALPDYLAQCLQGHGGPMFGNRSGRLRQRLPERHASMRTQSRLAILANANLTYVRSRHLF